jgi:hypothetical protein
MSLTAVRRALESRAGRIAIEVASVLTAFFAARSWGSWYWTQSLKIGRHPFFYQLYYEPAVMVACGRGFVVAQPQIPEMTRFLTEQTQTFDCADIPPGTRLASEGLYQGSSRYLMTAVGWTWRSVGVSWRKLGPFAGLLFAVAIVAAYGIFRLGMGRVLASLLAAALSLSTLHVANLPHIRDYAKAPFILLLIFLLGLLVKLRPSWRGVLLISAAAGFVACIGYGFRSDLLIAIPAFVVSSFLFLDASWRDRLRYGVAGTAVLLLVFYISARPVIASVQNKWGCQWHTAIIGLNDLRPEFQVQPSPVYQWMYGASDEFVYTMTTSYAARLHPGQTHAEYCGPAYDDITRGFMLDVAAHTPADFLIRAYDSALQMLQLPLRWRKPPMPDLATRYYAFRTAVTSPITDAGLFIVAIAVLLITAYSVVTRSECRISGSPISSA